MVLHDGLGGAPGAFLLWDVEERDVLAVGGREALATIAQQILVAVAGSSCSNSWGQVLLP